MSHSYLGDEPDVEQLVRVFAQVLDSNSSLRRNLFDLDPHKIHAVERDLSAILCAVRTIRNTHVPINKLPPEVLSKILEHRARERDLITATHVCQHWRSILTLDPSLWTCFRFRPGPDLNRTLVYLERSKSALIDVSVDAGEPRGLDALSYLAPNISRMRSLSIRVDNNLHPALLLFCNPAPSLRHLDVRGVQGLAGAPFLPDNFLAKQAPSLRSINLIFIRPASDHPFPLPNLTEFYIHLPEGGEPFRISALLRFFSNSPLLQKIDIHILSEIVQDIPLDHVTSLDLLVEMNYSYNQPSSILPFLRLPRLKQLQVSSSVGLGQMQWPDNILSHHGRALLVRTTRMSYYTDPEEDAVMVTFSGNEVKATFSEVRETEETAVGGLVNWLSNQTAVPFGQIEELEIGVIYPDAGFHIDAFALENLKILRVMFWDRQFMEEVLRLFHPVPQTGVPCRSLREIEYRYWGVDRPSPRSLISLVEERKRAGYQLGFFRLVTVAQEFDQDLAEELRKHVLEVQAGP